MNEEEDGEGRFSINLNTVLALLTLLWSFNLIAPKLSSDRPAGTADKSSPGVGDQTVEMRLWEDPFDRDESSGRRLTKFDIEDLRKQIFPPSDASDRTNVLILPVMVPGGPFSEDRESRIRSRFSVVSALGRWDYVPVDAEHIGMVELPWPGTREIREWLNNPNSEFRIRPDSGYYCPGALTAKEGQKLLLSYEWYKPKTIFTSPKIKSSQMDQSVLILWLNEDEFEDVPNVRLGLLFKPLIDPPPDGSNVKVSVNVLGPRRSSTLRQMVLDACERPAPATNVLNGLKQVLSKTEIYSATASAMDEVLVPGNTNGSDGYQFESPRQATWDTLKSYGYHGFHNLAATDPELARAALDELKIRATGFDYCDLSNKQNHLVMISEWDTFYSRMISRTYAAEMSIRQHDSQSRLDFINGCKDGSISYPTNFHTFVYLRGLDGQSARDGARQSRSDPEYPGRVRRPTTIEEAKTWVPDANKAEGAGQFDYVGRLADEIRELDEKLKRNNQGKISAISINGSDVYDTLLLLQALRAQFPDIYFITTDLDARFFHPREQNWTRNLIVVSGYGLQLAPAWQKDVAPFRDSAQTAIYAATLAALGARLGRLDGNLQPRVFEIGRKGAVNLSRATGGGLHPLVASEKTGSVLPRHGLLLGAVVFGCGFLLLSFLWDPIRRLTWGAVQAEADLLWYREEDLGSEAGVKLLERALLEAENITDWAIPPEELDNYRKLVENEKLKASAVHAESADQYLAKHESVIQSLGLSPDQENDLRKKIADEQLAKLVRSSVADGLLKEKYENRRAVQRMLELLQKSLQSPLPDQGNVDGGDFNLGTIGRLADRILRSIREVVFGISERIMPKDLQVMRERREQIDDLLTGLTKKIEPASASDNQKKASLAADSKPGERDERFAPLQAAISARQAARQSLKLCRNRVLIFRWGIVAALLFGARLAWLGFADTFQSTTGEGPAWNNGTSVWPTEFLRFGVVVIALGFLAASALHFKQTIMDLTRRYRLPLLSARKGVFGFYPQTSKSQTELSAMSCWEFYQSKCQTLVVVKKLAWYLSVYLLLGFGLVFLQGLPLRPTRGQLANEVDLVMLFASSLLYLILTFWVIVITRQSCLFIEMLSECPTRYPKAAQEHYRQLRGDVKETYLDEWLDLQLIADLTEQVGKLIYLPFFVYFLLLLSRHSWFDHWTWPLGLVLVFALNLGLAAFSVLVLQRAAWRARKVAIESLKAKLNRLSSSESISPEARDKDQADVLLQEIRGLHRGAFVPIWKNPVIGALLVPSGGTALIEFMGYLLNK